MIRNSFCLVFFLALSEKFDDLEAQVKPQRTFQSLAMKSLITAFFDSSREVVIKNFVNDRQVLDQAVLSNFKSETIPFKLIDYNNAGKFSNRTMKKSEILIFSAVDSLDNFNDNAEIEIKPAEIFLFLVLCLKATFEQLSNLKDSKILQFQYFIIEETEAFRLLTFVWYTAQKCNETQLIEVNRFDKKQNTWKNSNFVMKKFRNLHGCQVVFGVHLQNPITAYDILENGTIEYWGYNIDVFEDFAEKLNYSLKLNPYYKQTGDYYFKELKNVTVLTWLRDITVPTKTSVTTQPYMFLSSQLAVSPGDDFTSFEKLWLPFDATTWGLIIFIFTTAILTIFLLRFSKNSIRKFVFGRNVKTPSLNIAAHFFGTSQHILPGRNFARFMTTMFILYSLIIRTAWQGKMFEFMQKNMTKPGVQSIEEMIVQNFTFYVRENHIYHFDNTEITKRYNIYFYNLLLIANLWIYSKRIVAINASTELKLIYESEEIFSSKFKGAIHLQANLLYIYVSSSSGRLFDRIFKTRLGLEMSGLAFPIGSKLFEVFDYKLRQLFTGGIINQYASSYQNMMDYKRYAHKHIKEPQVLTMEHLEAGFKIWFASILIAFAAFLCEWLAKFKEFLIFKNTRLLARFRPKKEKRSLSSVVLSCPVRLLSSSVRPLSCPVRPHSHLCHLPSAKKLEDDLRK